MFTVEFDDATKNLLNNIGGTDTFAGAKVIDLYAALNKFYAIAGAMATASIRKQLGKSNLYNLNAEYAAKKMQNPFRMHVPGTDPDSPLILSGAMYSAINAHATAYGVMIGFNFDIVVPRAAQFFQWKQLRADRAMKATITNTHARRRAAAPRLQTDVIKEYSLKWENQTHFMEKGIQLSIPDMADALRYILSEVVTDNAMGMVTVTDPGEAVAYLRRPEDALYNNAKFVDKMERIQAIEDLEHGGEFTGEGAVYPAAEQLAPLAERQAMNPTLPSGVDIHSAEFDAKYKAWDEARTAQLEAEHGLGVNARPEFGPRTTLEVTDDRWLKPHQVYVKSEVSRHAFDSQQAAQRAGMTYEQWLKSYKPELGGGR